MSVEDPLVNGIPLSSLRVVDLKDELEKRGLSKIGNKSVLTERLKAHICENELHNSGGTTEKSSAEMSASENPLVAAYLARQAEVLEMQKREAERIRNERGNGDDSNTDEIDESAPPSQTKPPRSRRQQSESQDQHAEAVGEQSSSGGAEEQGSVEEPSAITEGNEEKGAQPSAIPEGTEEKAAQSVKKSPLSTSDKPELSEQQAEVDEINDEEIEKAVSVDGEPVEDKQSDDESTQDSQKDKDAGKKTPEHEVQKAAVCDNEVEESSKSKDSKQMEENGGSGGDHLEELDYGEVDAEADAEAEDRENKDEVMEVDDSEEREIRKQRRRLVMAMEESHDRKSESRRKVSPSRHPESEIIHIRGLTRPFTDRALKAEIMKSGGQIVDFWIDSVKSHCIVQMRSIDEAREVRNAMHNIQWPAANPKTLSVQFDTKENLERHRNGVTPSTASYPLSTTRPERKLSEKERPTIGNLPGRNPSLKITVEAAMRENEKREESREKERRERARAEKETDTRREQDEEKKEKREGKQQSEEKQAVKRDDHDRKRRHSETPPFSRSATEKRERRDSHSRTEYDRDHGRRRDDDRGRHRHHENEKEKEREEKPVKTADSLFMKTKTQPAIYFLPLTDEEVAERQEKLLAEKKKRENKEQEREKEKLRR